MRKFSFILALLLFSVKIYSQSNFNAKSLNVTKGDLETNSYERDSTANALVLYEYGNSYLDNQSFNLITEYQRKLKIFNKSGFEKATIKIYLYKNKNRKERVAKIKATTFNIDGNDIKTVKLEKKDIFEEEFNDNYTIVKFTFPNVKEGSVISYSYTLETPFMFKYKDWWFQEDIPKLYSEYNTSIPANWDYNIKLVGSQKLLLNHSERKSSCLTLNNGAYSDCTVSHYAMENISAIVKEDYMTTVVNYAARIEYELKTFKGFDGTTNNYTKTWKTVDRELKSDSDVGRQLSKGSAVKDLITQDITNETDALKKATKIFQYVQDNYTWNNKFNIYKDVSIKDLINNKTGSVSEINILLHNLLKENDFNVKPVLLSTRDNGFPTQIYPVMSDFNYLIVQLSIGNQSYLLDATDPYLSFGQLPFRCLNQYGRLLDFDNESSWINITPDKLSSIVYTLNLKLNEEQVLEGTFNSTSKGYHALALKKNYFSNTESYLKNYSEKYNTINFVEHQVISGNQKSFEFEEEFKINYREFDEIGDKLYINPFLLKFFTENPFKLQERTYPIDFGFADVFFYRLNIDIGDTYDVLEKPKDQKLALPNNKGSLIFTTKLEGSTLMLYFKLSFTESIYGPEYYESLKLFLGKVVDIQKNSLLVLQKK